MKEQIQKLAGLNQEVVNLIKEEKMDDAVEKLAEIQELTKEMDEKAVETLADPDPKSDDADAWESKEEIEKAMEMLEKYASLNIWAEDIKDMINQFNALKETITSGKETIEKLTERLEVVEKAKGISKQAKEDIEKKSDGVWGDLNIL